MENTQPESNHPVLTAYRERLATLHENYKQKIAELETQLAKLQADYANLDVRYANEIRARQDQETYTKEAFAGAIQSGYDKETITHLAYELDIDLTEVKTYTVQVEFQVEALVDLGDELEAYTLDAHITGDNIQDFTYEITGIDEN